MLNRILQINNFIEASELAENIDSVVFYGSVLTQKELINDIDLIIVVNNFNYSLEPLFNFLAKIFKKVDFHLYTAEEIKSGQSFFSREYVLEYLSKGLCVYGKNPFIGLYKNVSPIEYNRSIIIRSIEHVQMARKFYFKNNDEIKRINYLKKYILRIMRNILLFTRVIDHSRLEYMDSQYLIHVFCDQFDLDFKKVSTGFKSELGKDIFDVFNIVAQVLNSIFKKNVVDKDFS